MESLDSILVRELLRRLAREQPEAPWSEALAEWSARTGQTGDELLEKWPDAAYQWALLTQDFQSQRGRAALMAAGDYAVA